METLKAVPLTVPGLMTSANVVKPSGAPAEALPWLEECEMPRSPAPSLRAVVAARMANPDREAETLHWGIVALTALTALSILFGSHGASASKPRELLPVMIVTR